MTDLISVIVPVYNVEKYLNRCIDSILNQTYKNLEIILVDDGSTDNCGQICDEYEKIDSRIKVIHQENMGVSAARNSGLDIAKGKFIGFVDPDDYIHPQMYEILHKSITKNDADFVFCNYKSVTATNLDYSNVYNYHEKIYCKKDKVDMKCNNRAIMMVVWNKLYQKELFDNVRFPVGQVCEDAYILIDILLLCNKIIFIDEELYFYSLERKNSIMRKKVSLEMVRDELKAYRKMICYFNNNNFGNLYISYDWVYFKYISKIREHYYKVKKDFPAKKEILEKLRNEYINIYKFSNRKMIINIKRRILLNIFFIKCKLKL